MENNILDDPILIFKIIIWIFEISIEKLIFLCIKNESYNFSIQNLINFLKNEIYNFSNSNDIYSEILKINSKMNISNNEKNNNEDGEFDDDNDVEYILNSKDFNIYNTKFFIDNNKYYNIINNIIIDSNKINDIIIEEDTLNENISVELPIFLIVQQILESEYLEDFGNMMYSEIKVVLEG